ncbi:J domain-containing protein [Ruicaihuangia caeni]|uniref:DnaJ domain-containing protein n=1 Tax=Ruicaihuangia caeni TaxID=3042517 RepID=A0AAW6T7D2_9MICO|nr:DnaJ domain-containing protein [Klugiella sp. YN-L-19]MDI2097542.1 DnaJ domain-containing protein [Klugiella sp. YN-L-19]
MPDSPLASSPYEVLGVPPTASQEELRKAYRRMLRATHPDMGGNPVRFHAVQRAWQRVGTPEDRAAWDAGRGRGAEPGSPVSYAPQPPPKRQDSRPSARIYGHPGGWHRERFLTLMREWVGRGAPAPDLFDPALVQSAPREVRHELAAAIAEEQTARTLASLGIGFTVWHDVDTSAGKLDHIVLGPSGLYAMLSEDWGSTVRLKRGELIGEGIGAGERPVQTLARRAKAVQKVSRARFTSLLIVVPDDASPQSLEVIGPVKGALAAVVQQSRLADVMRHGLPGAQRIGGTESFEVRTRLQASVELL